MRNFQDIFETRKQSFISAFSICMTVPLKSSIMLKLSYALEKKSIIPVKDSRNCESESKVFYISTLLTIFLFSDATQKVRLAF